MNNIRVMIIDDEERSRGSLRQLITEFCPGVTVVAEADSSAAAEALINEHAPDLLFLDIEMPYANGFELLTRFPDPSFRVIFITAYNQYALKAIKVNALDYLLKPVDIDELQHAVNKAIAGKGKSPAFNRRQLDELLQSFREGEKRLQRLAVPGADGISYLDIEKITRCVADGNYTYIFTSGNEKIHTSRTLKDYEEMLSGSGFFRVHNSCLINLAHVKKYIRGEGGSVVMSDGATVEVSRRKKNDLLEKLAAIFS